MRCLDAAQIARAVTLGGNEPHLGECLACRRRFDADTAARDAIRILPTPSLGAARKRELAAELIARAQTAPRPARWRAPATIGAITALAAGIALAAWWPARTAVELPAAPSVSAGETTAISATSVARIEAPPQLGAPVIDASGGAVIAHATGRERDVLVLADGTVSLDTRWARNVDVKVGDAVIHVDAAQVTIRARKHAIVSVQVVVGAARVDSVDQHVILQRDTTWLPGPSAKTRSLAAFRDGWIQLRAGNNREAMALFDQVTDPVAREEASYWAAIAAKRSGDETLAAERLAKFLRDYPSSEYASDLTGE